MFEGNQGATAIAKNSINGGRAKHIDIRRHFIGEFIERKVLSVQFTESSGQHAGILMKQLGQEDFVTHRALLLEL